MSTPDLEQEKARQEQELRIQRQIAFASGLFQGDVTVRTLLESLAEGVVIIDNSGTILLVNARAEQMFGYPKKELVGMPHAVLIPERFRKIHEEHEAHFFAEPRIRPMGQLLDLAGRRRDGSEFPIEISLGFIETVTGVLVMALISDMTLRKQYESRLQESEELFHIQVEGVKDYAIFMLDKEGNVLNWNAGAESLKGYRAEEIIGRHFSCFYPEEEQIAGKPEEELKKAAAEGRVENEGWRVRKDGSLFWADVLITALYNGKGNLRGFSKVTRNITERKRAKEERDQLLIQLESVLDNINEGVVIANLKGDVLTMNKAALALHDYETVEQVRRPLSEYQDTFELFDLDGRLVPFEEWPLVRALRYERFVDYEVRILRKDSGKSQFLSYSGTPVHSKSGDIILSVITMRNVTERKQAEEEIKKLNDVLAARAAELEAANRELEAFNYTVAHDLRQPLNVISSYCQVIAELCGENLDEQCKGYLQRSYDGTLRMNRLIEALLNFSRMGHVEPRREMVDLCALAHEVVTMLKLTEPDRQVDFRIADEIVANADANLLRMVLDNLLGNAWKYSGMREAAVIEFGAKEIDGRPVYFVRDNGNGFDMKDADKLFAPFQRLPGAEKCRGFGIGLATVERIIRRHGGKIWAEGEPGKGATFYFTLSVD